MGITKLHDVGAMYFCWLNPGEVVGDGDERRAICPAAGGFAYLFTKDGCPADEDVALDDLPGCFFEVKALGGEWEDTQTVRGLPCASLASADFASMASERLATTNVKS